MNNKLFALTFTLAVKAVKVWLNSQGETVHPLVDEWVAHYFFGKGIEKQLPEEAVEETKRAIISQLWDLWECPTWYQLETATGSEDGWYKESTWYTTLWGVMGRFNYKMKPTQEGVKVSCWDLWDFNLINGTTLKINIDNRLLNQAIVNILKGLKIAVIVEESMIIVQEKDLAKLNKTRAFYTRWEFFLTWEELGISNPDVINWNLGGLPKWWIEKEAKLQALDAMKINYFHVEEELYVEDSNIEFALPIDWELINFFRKLSEEQLKPYQNK